MKKFVLALLLGLASIQCASRSELASPAEIETDDWFYPNWAANAPYIQPIRVRDTDSALGRYSLRTKEIGLKDLARMHGHLCDGLVIAFVQIKAILAKLFPDGVVDRTDLRAVSKNGPCWVDAVSWMTGARINFQTLRIDNSVGDGFIIQKISTGETYQVSLKPAVFPAPLTEAEARIRKARAEERPVSAVEIDELERLSEQLSRKMLTTPPAELVDIRLLPNYRFAAADLFGTRSDVINKDMPR
ncbi:MAG: formylmethanofuran dehydrogenase subunit E family protein [Gammaproteobacteria bacterium]